MPRAGLTEELLIEEGTHLIAEVGVDHFSIRSLAARLGVKPASLYNHMDSAEELLRKIGHRALHALKCRLEEARGGGSAAEQLRRLALAYRAFTLAHPALYEVLMRIPSSGDTELISEGRSLASMVCGPVRDILSPNELVHFSRAFRSAMHGFVSLELAGFFADVPSTEASYLQMVSSLIPTEET